ncbi:MAG TPA: glycosyltransferase family 2 protein [Gaiellaceae bacterium]
MPGKRIRRISVVAPMVDEAEHVESLVADLAAQDFDGELEIIVADGRSTDGSAARLRAAAQRTGLDVTVLDNPHRSAAAGLNRCIARATGDLIVRLDCHASYPPDFLRRCALASEETGAWNVGGILTARGRTPTERAVACAYDSPFGGIAWTRHLGRTDRVEVDLVHYGAFRPEVLERVGGYDEGLVVGEVEDLCERIREAGGTVVYDPAIRLYYVPRGSYRGVFVQYYRYGLWKVAAMAKHGRVLSARSMVPVLFVASAAGLGAASTRSRPARRLLAVELAAYGLGGTLFALAAVRGRREEPRLVPRVLGVFATFHLAHGLGQLHGWARQLRRSL